MALSTWQRRRCLEKTNYLVGIEDRLSEPLPGEISLSTSSTYHSPLSLKHFVQFWSLGRPENLNVSTARQRSTLTPRHQTPPNPSQTPDSARSHHIFTVGAASGDGIQAAEPLLTRLNGCFEVSSLPCSSLHASAWWDILQTDRWLFYTEASISLRRSIWPKSGPGEPSIKKESINGKVY